MEICPWCEQGELKEVKETVYWELPDGTRAIEISDTPSFSCPECQACFQSEETVKTIEDQLFLINTSNLEKRTAYSELMKKERILKRNYFDFS
ncbi:YokU family protein [Bacillus massiliglaciei]|uniref:YokU family protein n=1 Tax=Bacillus massiliglaciei TaxID=1816693 RepID=UPI000AF98B35|nr:YokU family protein [Bacillus massiliglaciei]